MTQHGATPNDWAAWQARELTEDLLPVVSNPGATISPKSKMVGLGKTPSLYNGDRHVVGIPHWPQKRASATEVKRWVRDSDLGICLQTRRVRAIDIDIADPAAAQAVVDLVEMGLGVLPARGRSNSGKVLLLLDMPGDFVKRVIRTEHGAIEFLANGQQCIVEGTHPSGARYEWTGLGSVIPAVTPAEFEGLWAELSKLGLATEERRGVLPVVPRAAGDMQDAMVAFLAENGWVTGYERDGRVDVRCPWEDEHTTDTGPSSTSWFPAGVGGFAQGHFRCLHAHCSGRSDGDFLQAVGYVAGDFDVVVPAPGQAAAQPLPAFVRARDGKIEATLNNVLMALRRPDVCGMRLGFDNFRGELMCAAGSDGGEWRPVDDETGTDLRSVLTMGAASFKEIGKETMRDALHKVARDQAFDSAKEWASRLEWDRVERLETFYSDFFSVADTPYTRAVARYTWTGLAARCLDPGHKCDMVPVLIGGQAAGKTTAVQALAPMADAFVEINLERKDDDLSRMMRGKLVGEIAELRGLQGRDAESIKAWISREFEEWTPKWKEFAARYYRRLIMFGTGNNKGFLDDDEERRWLPMEVGKVDVAGIRAVRDQLWAEGVWRFKRLGRVDWEGAYELARAEHAAFKAADPWEEVISAWLELDDMDGQSAGKRKFRPVRTSEVLSSALGIRADRADRRTELRLGKVMRRMGFVRISARVDGIVCKAWRSEQCLDDLA